MSQIVCTNGLRDRFDILVQELYAYARACFESLFYNKIIAKVASLRDEIMLVTMI